MTDGDGLYLRLFVKGGSHGWRLDYTVNGVRKNISLGTYPATTLALARSKAEEARRLVSAAVDPSDARKAHKVAKAKEREAQQRADDGLPPAGSFEAVARQWYATRRDDWSASYGDKLLRRLDVDVFPYIGRSAVGAVTAPELLAVLRRIEGRASSKPHTVPTKAVRRCSASRWPKALHRATRPAT